ncbi:MAG: xanthine dehydrogenase accessory protein XdhC [Pseudobdellovibrio sp.]
MRILKNIPANEDSVLITLIEYKGSVPQSLGAKALINGNGLLEGTVGGGKVEAKAIEFAKNLLKNKDAEICSVIEWNLTRDVGMTCGGIVKFLFEIHRPKAWHIVVFGAGHVAQELVPMLTKLEAHITCIDSRSEWLEKIQPQPNLTKIQVAEPAALVKNFNSQDYFVLMTQGHGTDLPILAEILKQHNPPYVGAIGSDTKALRLRTDLKNMDFSKEKTESFFCPIGLKIGNSTPVEISVSVMAQLLQIRDGVNGVKSK